MQYLNLDYLYTHAFERAVAESTNDFAATLENLEAETISLVKTYLSQYYDIDLIFSSTEPIENGVLKKIITKIILYEAVRRNAYRKVPADYKEDYGWAMETLEKLNTGKLTLQDLPPKTNANGSTKETLLWGNLSNKNYYI